MNPWVFALAGLFTGTAVGSIAMMRRLRQAEHRAVSAEAGIEGLRRQQDLDLQEISALREKLEAQQQARIVAETSLGVERKNLNEQQQLLKEAQIKLSDSFKAVAGDVLASESRSFLQLAQQRFDTLRAQAEGDLSARQQAIEALVEPLGSSLKTYGEMVHGLEKARAEAYGKLGSQVDSLLATNETLQRETGNLAAALRGSPQVRGRWGELTLRRVVELAGMSRYCDFTEQLTLHREDGRLRPDVVVNLPGGRRIAIDAKAALQPFLDAMDATTEPERRAALTDYGRLVRTHMNQLAARAYWEQLQPAPEMVVLFLPGDAFLSAALETDRTLIEDSIQKRVVMATPTTLVGLLLAAAFSWRQEQVEKNAQAVSEQGRLLYDRVRNFASHFAEVGSSLKRAVDTYNRATASMESRVLATARKFKDLGAATGEDIAEMEPIDEVPRSLRPEEQELLPLKTSVEDETACGNGAEKQP
ncbi:MAG TPA: DNA recombination protein RmuC [Terriglobia bacterium]|nr:DNA recombination protein RmuC [Terriglobia bacterium]